MCPYNVEWCGGMGSCPKCMTRAQSALRFKAGDPVRFVASAANPFLIGRTAIVLHVGPWRAGDLHPSGCQCIKDNDYIVTNPDDHEDPDGLACREANLEAA